MVGAAAVSARRIRRCSKTSCPGTAVSTLTYVYADSTVVLGPLSLAAEPHSYDLCATHATRMTAPRGWALVRLGDDAPETLTRHPDDLAALVDAVREAARADTARAGREGEPDAPAAGPARLRRARHAVDMAATTGRRNHLRVLPGPGPGAPEGD